MDLNLIILGARRKDCIQMKECNERNLSENYPLHYYQDIMQNFPKKSFILCDHNRNIYGYIMAINDCIVSFAIDKQQRGNKFGDALFKKCIDACTNSFITLHVRKSNEIAIKLYSKYGFSIIEENKEYYDNPKENAYTMEKKFKK